MVMTFELDHAAVRQVLQHERALRTLAAALLRDPADADDAVQHALVQEVAGRRRSGVPLWPFLRTALQRHAANLKKLARRRAAREQRAARPELVSATDELVQREQLRRRVADAVLALDEPYRTTVWLRWFEELPARAVAARMQVPLATVRTRLQRAHAQLRQRLDRDYGDRRWAAFAVPAAEFAIPLAANLAMVLTMKKVIAAVSVVLLAWLAYAVVLPSDAAVQTRNGNAVAAVAAADVSKPVANERREIAVPTAPSRALALRIVNADGTPAAGMPVWFWKDEATRPLWTRRVDATRRIGGYPAGTGRPGPSPPETTLRTDAAGRADLPEGAAPIAVSVEYEPSQWFSAALPAAGADLELPALAAVTATVVGGPPGCTWEGMLYPAWREPDGSDNSGQLRRNLDTRSGPGVVRMDYRRYLLDTGDTMRGLVPVGQLCMIGVGGFGFLVEGNNTLITAPAAMEFRALRRVPRLTVRVLETDGALTSIAGKLMVEGGGGGDLVNGVAVEDTADLDVGKHALEVLLADGDRLRGTVERAPGQMELRATLSRAAAIKPVRVRLADLPALADIADVRVDEGHSLQLLLPFGSTLFCDEATMAYAVGDGELLLNRMHPGWTQGYLVACDGRVAHFDSAAAGETVAGTWLPSAPPQTVDLLAIDRELGSPLCLHAVLTVDLPDSRGGTERGVVVFHTRDRDDEQPEPAPVWRDLRLPMGLRARLMVYGGGDRLAGLNLLRVVDLSPR